MKAQNNPLLNQQNIESFLKGVNNKLYPITHHMLSVPVLHYANRLKLIYNQEPMMGNKYIVNYKDDDQSAVIEAIREDIPIYISDINVSKLYKRWLDNPFSYNIDSLLVIPFRGSRLSDTVFALLILYFVDDKIIDSETLAKIEKIANDETIKFLRRSSNPENNELISSLKAEKEECEKKLKRDYDFFSAMVHDIRTPMNAILGFLELMESEIENNTLKEYIRSAYKSGELITSLINDILDMSKLKAGKIEIDKYVFTPITVFEDISNLFYYSAKKKGIYLTTYFNPNIPYTIESDPYRLKQIINNFLSNAIKFTPEGGSISLEFNYDEEEHSLYVSVSDTGIGMSEDTLKKIFSPYTQASKSIASKYGGTGLGLSISQQLATLLGGKIEVESSEGEGSTFTLILPINTMGEIIPTVDRDELDDIKITIIDTPKSDRENSIIIDLMLGYFNDLNIKYDYIKFDKTLTQAKQSYDSNRVYILDSSIINNDNINPILDLMKITHNHLILIESSVLLSYKEFENVPLIMRPLSPEKLFDTIIHTVHSDEKPHKIDDIKPKKTLKVLVVDDSFVNLKLLAEIVKKMNHKPIMAKDGEEAVKLFKEYKPDLIFIDKNMPNMNGIDAIKEIKKLPNSSSTKIFGLTGESDKKSKDEFISVGAIDVLVKPVQIKKLISIFENFAE